LALSTIGLRQRPPQEIVPAAQPATHAPAAQTWPAPHGRPHMPQLATSVCKLRQVGVGAVGVQSVWPAGHVGRGAVQAPAVHVRPAAQALAHAPQLLTSSWRLTQVGVGAMGAQSVWLAGHVGRGAVQTPATQVCPAPQTLPQRPQWAALVASATQVGAGAAGAQSVWPAGHVGRGEVQTPATQLSPAPQGRPHAPQCAVLTRVSTQ